MKSAEEWRKYYNKLVIKHKNDSSTYDQTWEELIKQIQLDAMKEGARRAVEMCSSYTIKIADSKEDILANIEQWTIKDVP